MECYEFTILEIARDTSPLMGQNAYLKVRDSSGVFIAFWGRPNDFFGIPEDMVNIEKIKSASLPVKVKVLCDYCLEADAYLSKGLGIRFSVSENIPILIIDEP